VLHEGYGLTEAAPGITLNRSGKGGSIGQALPGVEIGAARPRRFAAAG